MDSRLKVTAIITVFLLILVMTGVILYVNRSSLPQFSAQSQESVSEDSGSVRITERQIGTDPRAFIQDETFFDSEKELPAAVRKREENRLSLLMTSVQKDLRIRIVDNSGEPVKGYPFTVTLGDDKEYTDADQDGVIYIEFLRAGVYEVRLKETDEKYLVPETASPIEVKQSIEYAVIDDISLLMFTEDEVDPALEDLEVKEAKQDADKSEITKMREGNAGARVGIDVSKWNQEIDWDKVKNAGVEFAIVRAGYRGATTGALVIDPYFEQNMKGAARAGIPVGVYFFTQALNEVEAVEEASMVVNLIKEYDITYPVFIDTEGAGGNGRADQLDVETRTAVCKAFCDTIQNEGYQAGVYGGRNWLNEKVQMSRLDSFITWLAEYREAPIYQGYYHMWQYTSKGKVDGIEGSVDLNLSYLKIGEENEDELPVVEDSEQDKAAEGGEDNPVEPKPIKGTEDAEW